MRMKHQHTPTPWILEKESGNTSATRYCINHIVSETTRIGITGFLDKTNAEFIVRSVNAHDAYVKLAQDLVEGKTDHSVLVHVARLLLEETR